MSEQSSTVVSEERLILTAIDSRLKDLHTSLPGIIESFDPDTVTAKVQPAIRRLLRFETEEGMQEELIDLPICINVPVIFQRGGGYSMTFPVTRGDECMLTFCERSIDMWQLNGGKQPPRELRFHNLSDGMAIVGLSSQPNKIQSFYQDGIQIRKDDGSSTINIKPSNIEIIATTKVTLDTADTEITGNLLVKGTTEHQGSVTNKSSTTMEGNLNAQGDVTVTGALSQGGKNVGALHVHKNVTSGTANSGPVGP